MPTPTIAVTCAASDQGGESVAGGIYTAKLDQTEIYDGFVVPEQVTATADADGLAILNLWPNALGVNGSSYRITARNPDTGKKFFDASVVVPNNPCNLYQIIQNAPFPNVDSAQQALIDVQALVTIANQDVAATTADAQQAAADRLQTGEDRTAASDSAANALTSEQIVVAAHLDITTNWSDKLATAAVQAGIATTGGNTATTQAGISTAQAGQATAAKVAAELARDASFVTGPKYPTEAAGRVAVADGVNFLVQGSGDVAAYEYRRTSSTVSALIATYPSKSAVDALGQVFDNTAFTFQGYVSNGVYFANTSYRATDYLRIEGGANYTVTTFIQGNLTHDWYDANKAYISSFISPASVVATVTADAPANARYLRVSNTAGGAADARTGVRATTAKLNIDKVLKVVADNPPVVSSLNVTHGAGTVKSKLDSFDVTQAFLLAKQNDLLNELDLVTDASSPFFVPLGAFIKSGVTPATQLEVAVVSRVDAQTFTVGAGLGINLPGLSGAVVVKEAATGRHYSFGVKSNVADTITVFGTLPTTLSVAQTMHDGVGGQHLSRLGYKGLADFIVDRAQKYSYKKKKPLFVYHTPTSTTPVFSNPDVYKLDGVTKIVDMTLLGGAGNGGYVAGAGLLPKTCAQASADINAVTYPLTTYVSRAYILVSGAAGDGYEFKFPVFGISGFMEIPVGVVDQAYTDGGVPYRTTGRARVQVIGDGVTTLLDQTCGLGIEHFLYVNFAGVQEITVRVTLADTLPTSIHLHGLYTYAKSPDTPTTGFFRSGDVVGVLADSWGQFPAVGSGEVAPLRPDGSSAGGMQFLSARLKERLAADGIDITTLNMSMGGQTSAWGLHWIGKMLELTPKLTHCIINFWVNDHNSAAAAISGADTAYDFDPLVMYASKFQSAGGKKGAVTPDQWYANLQSICTILLRNGIKPIILMPGQTASGSQTQSIQQAMLNKIAPGFNNFNEEGGRE